MKMITPALKSIVSTLVFATVFSFGAATYGQKSGQAPRKSVSKAAGLVDEADKLADDRKYPEAIEAYKLAIRLDPEYAPAHGGLGDAYLNSGTWEQALAEYKEQVRLAPNDAQAQFDLGYFYNAVGRHGEAFAPLVKATALDPTFAEAFYGIGYAYLRGADFEKSIPFFRSAIRIKPDYGDAYYGLGQAYARLGKADLANEQLRKLTAVDPTLAGKLKKEMPAALAAANAEETTSDTANQSAQAQTRRSAPPGVTPSASVVTQTAPPETSQPRRSSPPEISTPKEVMESELVSDPLPPTRRAQPASAPRTLSAPSSRSQINRVGDRQETASRRNRDRSGTIPSQEIQKSAANVDWTEIVRHTMPGVVSIQMSTANGTRSGTGFIITSDGIVVTNYHVIRDVGAAQVITKQGEKFDLTGVIAFDRVKDFAVVKIPGFDLPVVPLGNSNDLDVGEPVSAIGDSLGVLTGTVSTGIISAKVRELYGSTWVQTTAPISHGNSGGPLLNRRGEAIGVMQGFLSDGEAQNLNLAVPINYVRGALQLGSAIKYTLAQLAQQEVEIGKAEAAGRAEAERQAFPPYFDPNGVFNLHVPKVFRVQHARKSVENGLTSDETIIAPESATLAELGGYLSEGMRVVVILPAPGGYFTPEAIEIFKAKAPEFALTGNPGFEVSNTGMFVINGLQAKVYTMDGKGQRLPEPERNVSYVFGNPRALVEIDVVVPASHVKILENLTQLAKTFEFNSSFVSGGGAPMVGAPSASGSQPTSEVTLRDLDLSFRSNLFDDTIRNAIRFLQTNPNSPEAHGYLGYSLLVKRDVENGVIHLEQAVLLGQAVTLPVKRLREPLIGQGLDDATISLTRESVIIRSGRSIYQANFSALSDYRLANYNNTCPIVFLKGLFVDGSNNKGKPSDKGFNLFPPAATLRPVQQGALVYNVAACNDEGIVTTAIAKLLYRLMARPR